MATYTKPTDIPTWNTSGLNRATPSDGKQIEGWLYQEIPPSTWENWRTNLVGQWAEWIDERIFDQDAGNSVQIWDPGSAASHTIFRTGGSILFSGKFEQDQVWLSDSSNIGMWNDAGDLVVGVFPLGYWQVDTSRHVWVVGGQRMFLDGDGLRVNQGLHVGSGSIVPTDDAVTIGDNANFGLFDAADPYLLFDSGNDRLLYDTSADTFQFQVSGVSRLRVDSEKISYIGGSDDYQLKIDTGNPQIIFAPNDYIEYDRTLNDLKIIVGGSHVANFDNSGLALLNGIRCGDAATPPTGKNIDTTTGDIRTGGGMSSGSIAVNPAAGQVLATAKITTDGGIACGDQSLAPAAGNATISGGLLVGLTGTNPDADSIYVGDTNFRLQWMNSTYQRLTWDNSANDYLQYDRGSNQMSLYIGGTMEFLWNDSGFFPQTGSVNDLGSVSRIWDDAHIGDVFVHTDANVPNIANHPWQMNKNNCPALVARVSSGGTVSATHPDWNILDVDKIAVGVYHVNTHEPAGNSTGWVGMVSVKDYNWIGSFIPLGPLGDQIEVKTQPTGGSVADKAFDILGFAHP